MNKQFFRKTNKYSIFILIIILLLIVINGLSNYYLHERYLEKSSFYIETHDSASNIQIKLQKQIKIIKDVSLSVNESERNDNYYKFSKYYTEILNDLFNLNYLFIDNNVEKRIEVLIGKYKLLSQNYLRFFFQSGQVSVHLPASESLIQNEFEVIGMMDEISVEIKRSVDRELISLNRIYNRNMAVLFFLQVLFTLILLIFIINNNKKTQKNLVGLSKKLNSYLPPQLINSILYDTDDKKHTLLKKKITVCFTDLQGFTELSNRNDAGVISRILNEYLIDMSTIAHAWGGMVDKFMGDGIMILFNAFDDNVEIDHAYLCVNMALVMQDHLKILNRKWHDEGLNVELSLRIGINSGYAILGSFGPEDRKSFTAVGNTVNIASRLENICPAGEVLLSVDTKKLLDDKFNFITTGKKIIKGLNYPQETFIVKKTTE